MRHLSGFFTLVGLLSVSALAHAKKPKIDEDHANHFRGDAITAGDVTIEHGETWARVENMKFRIKIANNSSDYFLLAKDGVRITMPSGEFRPASKSGKWVIIQPNQSGGHGFAIQDEGMQLHQVEWTANLVDTFMVSAEGAVQAGDDFTLPLASKSFKAGPFDCAAVGKVKQETDETFSKFSCTYRGKPGMVGTFNSEKIQMLIEDGTAFLNEAVGKKTLMMPGDKVAFKVRNTVIQPKAHGVDMQFSQLTIKWNDAFRESEMTPLAFEPWSFELDASLTAAKND